MPVLPNPKHERFAHGLAKGKTQAEAYVEAGYAHSDANAARLTGNDRIKARVAELLDRAAVRTEITVASITDRLLKIAKKGEDSTEAAMLGVARASLMDAAKLNGLVVEKLDARVASRREELSDDELTAIAFGGGAGVAETQGRAH